MRTTHRISLLLACVLFASSALAQTASVTFVHNSPDPAAAVIDLYVSHAGNTVKIDNLAFQGSSTIPEMAIFGGIPVTFKIAPSTSTDQSQALLTYEFTPAADMFYVVEARGLITTDGFAANPDAKPISAGIRHFEIPATNTDATKAGVIFVHSSTDLDKGDLWVRGASAATFAGVTYGDVTTPLKLIEAKSSFLDYTKAGIKTPALASFEVDLSGFAGQVLILMVSGFKSPVDNKNSPDTLTLLGVKEDGSISKYSLLSGSQTARVQVIHNAADPKLGQVDVFLNTERTIDNLNFRRATAFSNFPAGVPLVIGIAPATSSSYKDTLRTLRVQSLRPGRTYVITLSGILDSAKFAINPDSVNIALKATLIEGVLEGSPDTVAANLLCVQQSTDSKSLSLVSSIDQNVLLDMASYGAVSVNHLVAPGTDTLWLKNDSGIVKKGYVVNLKTRKAYVALTSGFVDPTKNMDGQPFKVILVDSAGVVNSSLVEVMPGTVSVQEETATMARLSLVPNPATTSVLLRGDRTVGIQTILLVDATGRTMAEYRVSDGMRQQDGISVSLERLTTGVYVVIATDANGSVVAQEKLIVTR
ncbi:hypothetical protein BH10BAC6_BH10BAC6_17500 [soil metagenome]